MATDINLGNIFATVNVIGFDKAMSNLDAFSRKVSSVQATTSQLEKQITSLNTQLNNLGSKSGKIPVSLEIKNLSELGTALRSELGKLSTGGTGSVLGGFAIAFSSQLSTALKSLDLTGGIKQVIGELKGALQGGKIAELQATNALQLKHLQDYGRIVADFEKHIATLGEVGGYAQVGAASPPSPGMPPLSGLSVAEAHALTSPPPAPPAPGKALEAMTVKELQAEAKARGLVGYSALNKADLLEYIKTGNRPTKAANPPVTLRFPSPIEQEAEQTIDKTRAAAMAAMTKEWSEQGVPPEEIARRFSEVGGPSPGGLSAEDEGQRRAAAFWEFWRSMQKKPRAPRTPKPKPNVAPGGPEFPPESGFPGLPLFALGGGAGLGGLAGTLLGTGLLGVAAGKMIGGPAGVLTGGGLGALFGAFGGAALGPLGMLGGGAAGALIGGGAAAATGGGGGAVLGGMWAGLTKIHDAIEANIKAIMKWGDAIMDFGKKSAIVFGSLFAMMAKTTSMADPIRWNEFRGVWAEVSVQIGSILLPVLDMVTDLLRELRDFMRGLSTESKEFISGIVKVGLVITGIVTAFSLLVKFSMMLVPVWTTLAGLGNLMARGAVATMGVGLPAAAAVGLGQAGVGFGVGALTGAVVGGGKAGIAAGALTGALTGGAMGAGAGLPGIAIGAIIGAITGGFGAYLTGREPGKDPMKFSPLGGGRVDVISIADLWRRTQMSGLETPEQRALREMTLIQNRQLRELEAINGKTGKDNDVKVGT